MQGLQNISAVGGLLLLLVIGFSPTDGGWAAEKAKPAKKPKAAEGATKASGASAVADSKVCFGDTPKIEKVTPDEGKPGDKITILGKNFGSPGCLSAVSFGPGNPAKFVHEGETKVTAIVPKVKRGIELLTVTTASGEDSKPFLVK